MVALVGDAELDEGNIYEALQEGWKNDLRNCWWIIDYNRQSLDGIVREGLFERVEKIFEAFGWDVVRVKYGALQRAAFEEPGGEKLRDWIDACPNQDYSALTFMGGAVWRKRLMDDLGDQGDVSALIDAALRCSELAALMENLGGNCVETMAETFAAIDHDRPTCFLAYTIKGWGTPIAGHKDNHGGLMTKAQMAEWQRHMGVPEGAGMGAAWQRCRTRRASRRSSMRCRSSPKGAPLCRCGAARARHRAVAGPRDLHANGLRQDPRRPVQDGDSALAERIVTTSPDVTGTTVARPWVNRRKLFARGRLPTPSSSTASPPPRNGSSRRRASTSSWASPR
jgi:pyruvate dehydrogenase E1 component